METTNEISLKYAIDDLQTNCDILQNILNNYDNSNYHNSNLDNIDECINSLLLTDQLMENEQLNNNDNIPFLFGKTNSHVKKNVDKPISFLFGNGENSTLNGPKVVSVIDEPLIKFYPQNTTFDVIINDIYGLLDPNNSIHNHLKILCDSLKIDTLVNTSIKDLIIHNRCLGGWPNVFNFGGHVLLKISDFSKELFARILNQNLTDFTLVFPNNNTFPCLKAILMTIPYFEMQFRDTQITNSINLTSDYEMTTCLIKTIHYGRLYQICDLQQLHDHLIGSNMFPPFEMPQNTTMMDVIKKYIELFKLMDEFLMVDHFHIMLKYADNNIVFMVEELVANEDYDNLKLLYRILRNIADEQSIKSKNTTFDIVHDANEIIKKLFKLNIGEYINIFDDWKYLVDDNYKEIAITLKEIHKSGNYELLNTSNILPRIVISFLALINLSNNKYSDIFETVESYKATLFFDKPCTRHTAESEIVISSYYPVLTYIKFLSMPISILQNKENYIIIKILRSSNQNITIGSQLLFQDRKSNTFGGKSYGVELIKKCANAQVNNNTYEKYLSCAEYMSPIFKNFVNYKIFFDRPCNLETGKQIFLIESYTI